MKYETPQLTALTPAIDAIQGSVGTNKYGINELDSPSFEECHAASADWE